MHFSYVDDPGDEVVVLYQWISKPSLLKSNLGLLSPIKDDKFYRTPDYDVLSSKIDGWWNPFISMFSNTVLSSKK
jgi:hypothetical protein